MRTILAILLLSLAVSAEQTITWEHPTYHPPQPPHEWAWPGPDTPTANQPNDITPETPQPQVIPPDTKQCGPRWLGGCWNYNHRTLTTWQTFKSPHWWAPTAAAEAAYWTDVATSLQAVHRGCLESNPDLSLRPSLGDYAENWAKTELLLDGFQWGITKLNRRVTNWMVVGMSTARVGIHMRGINAALTCH